MSDTQRRATNTAFAQRLRGALDAAGVRASPTVVAHEFNLRYWGKSITAHAARNWLLGNAIPTQDKLQILAEWLKVGPDELRFGVRARASVPFKEASSTELSLTDREMLRAYLSLGSEDRRVVRHVVTALSLAHPPEDAAAFAGALASHSHRRKSG